MPSIEAARLRYKANKEDAATYDRHSQSGHAMHVTLASFGIGFTLHVKCGCGDSFSVRYSTEEAP